jgi:dihydropteroate synthase
MLDWHLRDRVLALGRRPLVMGIVNVTPDSFSDGGLLASTEAAVSHGLELVRQGADLLDIGGESTRPGSAPVPQAEELRRVLPVVQALAAQVSVPISVDTSKAEVARQCLAAGAGVINDVTALTGDPAMPEVVLQTRAGAILMHMQGTPATMQNAPQYEDVVADISRYFQERLHALTALGIAADRLALDPGIGFGKRAAHNLQLLARLTELGKLGRPICLGVSRKGFLGRLLDRPVDQRLIASVAALASPVLQGAVHIVRVHDVQATCEALTVWEAIASSEEENPKSEIRNPKKE